MNKPRDKDRRISILTYHSIEDNGSVISTAPKTFREQMRYLSEAGFRVMTVGEVVASIRSKEALPERAVSIAFDDGYENVFTDAYPILQDYGFTATVFLITNYCGRHNDWPGNLPTLERRPLLSWPHIKEMSQNGVEFGAHTRNHPNLTLLTRLRLKDEIAQSKSKIEDRTGRAVATFAYPYGRHNSEVRAVVREHFDGACSTELGRVGLGSDLYLLPRFDMYYLSRLSLFRKLETTQLNAYFQLRQALRGLRQFLPA
jgi:peptidoglycan/xylan/chitin deacetylase (PgdA/CDA1 family)